MDVGAGSCGHRMSNMKASVTTAPASCPASPSPPAPPPARAVSTAHLWIDNLIMSSTIMDDVMDTGQDESDKNLSKMSPDTSRVKHVTNVARSRICYEDDDDEDDVNVHAIKEDYTEATTSYKPADNHRGNKIIVGSKPSNTKELAETVANKYNLENQDQILESRGTKRDDDKVIRTSSERKRMYADENDDGIPCYHCTRKFPDTNALTLHLYNLLGIKVKNERVYELDSNNDEISKKKTKANEEKVKEANNEVAEVKSETNEEEERGTKVGAKETTTTEAANNDPIAKENAIKEETRNESEIREATTNEGAISDTIAEKIEIKNEPENDAETTDTTSNKAAINDTLAKEITIKEESEKESRTTEVSTNNARINDPTAKIIKETEKETEYNDATIREIVVKEEQGRNSETTENNTIDNNLTAKAIAAIIVKEISAIYTPEKDAGPIDEDSRKIVTNEAAKKATTRDAVVTEVAVKARVQEAASKETEDIERAEKDTGNAASNEEETFNASSDDEPPEDMVYKCPECTCIFRTQSNLTKHLQSNHNLVEWHILKYVSDNVSLFDSHIQCPFCPTKSSYYYLNYNGHIKRMHYNFYKKPGQGEIGYKCLTCKEVFHYSLAMYHKHPGMKNKPIIKKFLRKPGNQHALAKSEMNIVHEQEEIRTILEKENVLNEVSEIEETARHDNDTNELTRKEAAVNKASANQAIAEPATSGNLSKLQNSTETFTDEKVTSDNLSDDESADKQDDFASEDLAFKCQECQCIYKNKKTLVKHLISNHDYIESEALQYAIPAICPLDVGCSYCPEKNSSYRSHNAHIKRRHNSLFTKSNLGRMDTSGIEEIARHNNGLIDEPEETETRQEVAEKEARTKEMQTKEDAELNELSDASEDENFHCVNCGNIYKEEVAWLIHLETNHGRQLPAELKFAIQSNMLPIPVYPGTEDITYPHVLKEAHNQLQKVLNNLIYLCSDCGIFTDEYDHAVEHSQNHLNNIIDVNKVYIKKCEKCHMEFEPRALYKHKKLHTSKHPNEINMNYFKILKYNYRNILTGNWLTIFSDLPKPYTDYIIAKSIYRATLNVRMRIIRGGSGHMVYQCGLCNEYIKENSVYSHTHSGYCFTAEDDYEQTKKINESGTQSKIIMFNHEYDVEFNKMLKIDDTAVTNQTNNTHKETTENQSEIPSNVAYFKDVVCKPTASTSVSAIKVFKCKCGLHFGSLLAIEKHFVACPNDTIQSANCSKCYLLFPTDNNILVNHAIKHHRNDVEVVVEDFEPKMREVKLYECARCSLLFPHRADALKHNDCGTNIGETCHDCNLIFHTDSFKVHECTEYIENDIITVDNTQEYTTTVNDTVTDNDTEASGTIGNDLIFKCAKCDIHYLNMKSWFRHVELDHKNGQVVVCELCKLTYTTTEINNHKKLHHEDNHKDDYLNVKVMGSDTIKELKVLKEPTATNNQIDKKRNVSLSRERIENSGRRIGEKSKREDNILYKCNQCPQHFVTRSTWIKHMFYSTNHYAPIEECSDCKYEFNSLTMFQHQAKHHTRMKLKREELHVVHYENSDNVEFSDDNESVAKKTKYNNGTDDEENVVTSSTKSYV